MTSKDITQQFTKILIDDDLMEIVQRSGEMFPFDYYYENVANFDFHCVDWHWHTEFEFVYIESGTVQFCVGQNQFDLSEGYGILINSKMMHRLYSKQDAIIPNFLCLPTFWGSDQSKIYQKFVMPVLHSAMEYIVFSPEVEWQKQVLEDMKRIIEICGGDRMNELAVSVYMQKLWLSVYLNAELLPVEKKSQASAQARVQLMMQYIHSNYAQNITLLDIADAVNVSKSTALNLFRAILNTSPVNYLVSYRLKRAASLLMNTEKKIGAISLETGFHDVDYFCKTFKRHYSVTPTEYRKEKQSKK